MQKIGVYITYYASAMKVREKIDDYSIEIQRFELSRIFSSVGIAGNNRTYNALLNNFLPGWNMKINKVKIFGSGAGRSSINTYRVLTLDNILLHEKIYFSTHKDLHRIHWFYENCIDLVSSTGIIVPRVLYTFKGKVITALYSEYVACSKFPRREKEEGMLGFVLRLYNISFSNSFNDIILKSPDGILDYQEHFFYKKAIDKARKVARAYDVNLLKIEDRLEQGRYVLSHGDIHDGNAFINNVLIDWDSVGICPAGFDAAYLLYQLILTGQPVLHQDIKCWIKMNFVGVVPSNEYATFELSIHYFLFVFIQEKIEKDKYDIFNVSIIDYLVTN